MKGATDLPLSFIRLLADFYSEKSGINRSKDARAIPAKRATDLSLDLQCSRMIFLQRTKVLIIFKNTEKKL